MPRNLKKFTIFAIFLLLATTVPITVYLLTRDESIGDTRNQAAGPEASVIIYPEGETYQIAYGSHTFRDNNVLDNPDRALYSSWKNVFTEMGMSQIRSSGFFELRVFEMEGTEGQENREKLHKMLDLAGEVDATPVTTISPMGAIDPNNDHHYYDLCSQEKEVTSIFPKSNTNHEPVSDPSVYDLFDYLDEFVIQRHAEGKTYVHKFELGNEEYFTCDENGVFMTPSTYITGAKNIAIAIKEYIQQEAPAILDEISVYGVAHVDDSGNVWGNEEYLNNKVFFDGITYHRYWHNYGAPDLGEGESLYSIDFALRPELELYETTFTSASHFQHPALTEWNYRCWGTDDIPHRNCNHFEHTLFIIGRQLLNFDFELPVSTVHETNTHTCSLQGQEEQHRCGCAPFYLTDDGNSFEINASGVGYKTLTDHFGDTHINSDIDSPLVSVDGYGDFQSLIGGSSSDSTKLYLILVNRSELVDQNYTDPANNITTDISIDGYTDSLSYTHYQLAAPHYDSHLADITFTEASSGTDVANGFEINVRNQSASVIEITLNTCTPDCNGKECGSNGCDGTCGTCSDGKSCSTGVCISSSGASPADINGDGNVSMSDYTLFVEDYLAFKAGDPIQSRSDLNSDNDMTMDDYAIFVEEYLKSKT